MKKWMKPAMEVVEVEFADIVTQSMPSEADRQDQAGAAGLNRGDKIFD